MGRPWDDERRAPAAAGRARAGRAGRRARLPVRVGGRAPLPGGVQPLLGARGVPRRVQPAHDAGSGSVTASCSPRRSSTTRPGSPSGSRCSTCSPTAGSSSAAASRRARPSWPGSRSTRRASATRGSKALETALRCMVEVPFTGVDGEFVQMPPRNVVPKPRQKPHPPLWVACSRRETIRLGGEQGHGRADVRVRRPRGGPDMGAASTSTHSSTCDPVGWTVTRRWRA